MRIVFDSTITPLLLMTLTSAPPQLPPCDQRERLHSKTLLRTMPPPPIS
jgi:hypothetical protein